MSIATQIQRLNSAKSSIKTAIENKGVTIGNEVLLDGYSTYIDQIETGGGGTEPLDPYVVYAQTRPAYWLPMPSDESVLDNEIYMLIDVPNSDEVLFAFSCNFTGTAYIDFGDGTTPQALTSGTKIQYAYNYNNISGTPNAEGNKQVMAKVYGGTFTTIDFNQYHSKKSSSYYVQPIAEIKMRATSCSSLIVGGGTSYNQNLKYFSYLGANNINNSSYLFYALNSLITIPQLDTSKVTDMSYMFYNCYSLITIPLFNTSKVTNMSYMFNNCYSLTSIPLLNTSSVTDMNNMFNNCFSLITIPLFNTSLVTNMSNMFYYCYSLQTIPQLDTSKVTNMRDMFYYCYSLTSIPLLNTSSVTSMFNMFYYCYSLQTIPQLNTSLVQNMSYMFYYCYSLTSIPLFNTSSVINISSMFTNCYSLKKVFLSDVSKISSSSNMNLFGTSTFRNLLSKLSFGGSQLGTTAVTSINLKGLSLSRQALIDLFTELPIPNVTKTLILTGTQGVADLTQADKDIALNKGYLLTL